MGRILGPHKEQEAAVYIRALRVPGPAATKFVNADASEYVEGPDYFLPTRSKKDIVVSYDDSRGAARTISSRRVEEAVETADYLKLCEQEGLIVARQWLGLWGVAHGYSELHPAWPTLREAYHRYKAAQS